MRFWEVSLILCLILDLNKMKHQISYDLAKKKEMWSERTDLWTISFCSCLCSYFMSFLFLISSVMKMDGCLLFILAIKLNFEVAKKLPSWECFRIFTNTSAVLVYFHSTNQSKTKELQLSLPPLAALCPCQLKPLASSVLFAAPYWSMCSCFASFTSDAWKLTKAPGTGP